MEDGLKLPWWEFRPTDFTLPGTVEPPDSRAEERLLAGFLQAGARAETADFFISGAWRLSYSTCWHAAVQPGSDWAGRCCD